MTQTLPGRFAAIADIHGNADALRAVLADIDAQAISRIVNLGDVFSGPLAAGEVWEMLKGREMPTARGNHDRYLIDQPRPRMHASDAVAYDDLPPEALDWLRGLPMTLDLGDVFLCHATPGDDQTYWLHDVSPRGDVYPAPRAAVAAYLGGIGAPMILCAHTHLPRTVRIGRSLIVNPGSVGCPAYDDTHPVPHVVQTGTPDACYAVLTRAGQGWQVTHRHVSYDPSRMASRAMEHGRPGWAQAVSTGWLLD